MAFSANTTCPNVVLLDLVDQFISEEECADFLVKMCSDTHERVVLPLVNTPEVKGELTLSEFLVLKNDADFKSKFELYYRKDKLGELLEEFLRKKGDTYFMEKVDDLNFWVKLEKCDARVDNLEGAFDVFVDIYTRFIGFSEEIDESETNPNKIINVEVKSSYPDSRRCQRPGAAAEHAPRLLSNRNVALDEQDLLSRRSSCQDRCRLYSR